MSSRRTQVIEQSGPAEIVRPVLISVAVGAVVSILILLLMSAVLASRNIPHGAIGPMSTFAISAGAFASGFCSAKMFRRGGLAFGALSSAALCLVVMLASLTVGDNGFGLTAVFKIVFMLLAGMLGGVLGVNTRRRRKK